MKLEIQFEQLKKVFKQDKIAEKLIVKNSTFKLKKSELTNISIEDNYIYCEYNVNTRYKFKLTFKKDNEGFIDFKLKQPALFYIITIGALLGGRFVNEFGYFGIVLGILLFYFTGWLYKFYLQNKLGKRILIRWDEVVKQVELKS